MSYEFALVMTAAAAILILAYQAQHDDLRRRTAVAREVAIVISAYFAYFLVRGATEGDLGTALQHARRIEDWERALGIFIEPTLQAAIVGEQWGVELVNYGYLWGHWPVIIAAAIWLYIARPEAYHLYRTAFLISGAIGLVFFWAFPTAPPRLATFDLVDTVTQHADIYRLLQPKALTNQYAAFPSLHFGWNLLIGVAVVREARSGWLRALGVLSPLTMLAAVVLTANHYILDAVAGAVIALGSLQIAVHLLGTGGHRPALRAAHRSLGATGTVLLGDWLRPSIREIHRRAWLIAFDDRCRPSIFVRRGSADAGDGSPLIPLA